jgi:hypothetical protein
MQKTKKKKEEKMGRGWKMSPFEWVRFIMVIKPLIEWLVTIVERIFTGSKRGKEKKEFVETAVSNIFSIEEEEIKPALSDSIDTIVKEKNDSGEFSHTP